MQVLKIILISLIGWSSQAYADQGCHSQDSTHRYVTAPVYYDRPGDQTFRLYYEVSNNFDPAQSTLFYFFDAQQSGDGAEALKEKYGVKFNILRMEHRGFPCSPIADIQQNGQVNWKVAYEVIRSENVIEDIDLIRRDLLGTNGKLFVYGGSGGGILAAQYLAKYSSNVDKIFIERASDNLAETEQLEREYFFSILKADNVYFDFLDLIANKTVPLPQLLWILQRAGYDYTPQAHKQRAIIASLKNHDFSLYEELSKEYENISAVAPVWQQLVTPGIVRIFEVFPFAGLMPSIPSALNALEPLIRPLTELNNRGVIHVSPINVRTSLQGLPTDTLLVAARWDHVLPFQTMLAMNRNLPNSRLVVLDNNHKMPKGDQCHGEMFRAFFEHGKNSPELEMVLKSEACRLSKKS